jgi:hypothetical protein
VTTADGDDAAAQSQYREDVQDVARDVYALITVLLEQGHSGGREARHAGGALHASSPVDQFDHRRQLRLAVAAACRQAAARARSTPEAS